MKENKSNHVVVIGGAMVGNITALALADAGYAVTLVTPETPKQDPRTTALLHGSIEYLQKLGVWKDIEKHTHPLAVMRLIDAGKRLVRSPQIDFRADEIGLEAFGYNIRNQDALDEFEKRVIAEPKISICQGVATAARQNERNVLVTVSDQHGKETEVVADFLVGADGRNSMVRNVFLPEVRQWQYPQAALVVDFTHQVDSRHTSTEFHTETGPFTVVPQSAHRAGLVWMERADVVDHLLELSSEELAKRLEQTMSSYLGKVTIEGAPSSFPIRAMIANKFGDRRVFLVGDAAHVFPPIGAQGFNLGLRDVETLVTALANHPANPGQYYSGKRAGDIGSRTLGVDLLNRSLLYSFLPLQFARSAGVHMLNRFGTLRKAVMKLGISTEMFIKG